MAKWGFWDWVSYICLGIAAVSLAAGAAVKSEPEMFERLPAFFTSPRWAFAPAIFFAIGSVILAVRFAAPLIMGSNVQRSTEKVFVDVKPEHLFGLVKGHTLVQQDQIGGIYKGKWLRLSGPVRNVYSVQKETYVTITIGDHSSVQLMFNHHWLDRTRALVIGQNISAIGQIERITTYDINLINSEISE